MTLQLTDNNWELKLDTSLDAEIEQHLLGTFINPYVVVNVTSDSVLPSWRQAGNIGQAVSFDNEYAHGEIKLLTLNKHLLLQFPLLTGDSYDLYYFPFSRLVTAKIKVWEYKGETVNTSIAQLVTALENSDNLTVDLSGLQTAIDCIKADLLTIKNHLGIEPPVPPPTEQDLLFFLFN